MATSTRQHKTVRDELLDAIEGDGGGTGILGLAGAFENVEVLGF